MVCLRIFPRLYFTSSSVVLIILPQGGKTFAVRFLSVKTVSVKQNCRCHSLQVKGAGQRNTILVLTTVYTIFFKTILQQNANPSHWLLIVQKNEQFFILPQTTILPPSFLPFHPSDSQNQQIFQFNFSLQSTVVKFYNIFHLSSERKTFTWKI